MVKSMQTKNFSFGINIHNDKYPAYPATDLKKNLDICNELGLNIVRYNHKCDTYEGIETVKKVANECHKRGMKFMLVIDDNNWYKMETDSLQTLEKYYACYFERVTSSLKDKVDYYQLFNEMDVVGMRGDISNIVIPGKDGREKGEYDSVRFDKAIASMKGALKGIKKGYQDAKTCVNFSWWHTALVYEMYRQGCRWDLIGLDWYSDCEEVSSIDLLIDDVRRNIPESQIMICETNYWMHPHQRDTIEKQEAIKVKQNRYEYQEKWIPEFIDKLVSIDEPHFLGVIFYELLDQPIYEIKRGAYHGESHFGFVESDEDGGNRVKKPAFYSLQEKIKEIKGN